MVEKEQIKKILSDIERADNLREQVNELESILSGYDNLYKHEVSLKIEYRKRYNDRDNTRIVYLDKDTALEFISKIRDNYKNKLKPYEETINGTMVINTNGF